MIRFKRTTWLRLLVLGSFAVGFEARTAPLQDFSVRPATTADFQVLNACAHAATIAVWAAERSPHDADRRMKFAHAAREELVESGIMGDDTPDVALVMVAMIGVESLFKSGAKLTQGQMHDWFVAQSAGLCARTVVRPG